MKQLVYILNGPNLNLLGKRQPEIYGRETLAEVERDCAALAGGLGLEVRFLQSNWEGQLVDWIHEARGDAAGIAINPGAFTHTSVAILDALNAFEGTVIEVHISNVHKRESFRHRSYVSLRADGIIVGCGTQGYQLALRRIAELTKGEPMITGRTKLIAHLGYPTESFRAPMIYNPYFEKHGIDAVVVPMGVTSENYAAFLPQIFKLSNIHGALVTMPHKVTSIGLLDEVRTTAEVAGACNAVRLDAQGRLVGEMFDGEGFVRGLMRKGRATRGARALVVGSGGVGSAIAASLARAGVARLGLFDPHAPMMDGLAARLRKHYPALEVVTGSRDPAGYEILVNATPLGMKEGDPLPMDVERIDPSAFVGEVVMKQEITPFLAAARARGCQYQVGTDMLFEQIPAYLEFFGLPTTTAEELREVARVSY